MRASPRPNSSTPWPHNHFPGQDSLTSHRLHTKICDRAGFREKALHGVHYRSSTCITLPIRLTVSGIVEASQNLCREEGVMRRTLGLSTVVRGLTPPLCGTRYGRDRTRRQDQPRQDRRANGLAQAGRRLEAAGEAGREARRAENDLREGCGMLGDDALWTPPVDYSPAARPGAGADCRVS